MGSGLHSIPTREDHSQEGNETRIKSRRHGGQNMCQCISQVQQVSRHRARSTVNRRMMRQQGQSENQTTSSLECARVSIGEEGDHMEGKGGGRQRLRYIDGDVPRCIRHNDDKSKSTAAQLHTREKEKGSSNEEEGKENEEGGSVGCAPFVCSIFYLSVYGQHSFLPQLQSCTFLSVVTDLLCAPVHPSIAHALAQDLSL